MKYSTVFSVSVALLCLIHGNRGDNDEQSPPPYEAIFLPELGHCGGEFEYYDSYASFSMMYNLLDSYMLEPSQPSSYNVTRLFANDLQTDAVKNQYYIIHGWGGNPSEQWISDLTDAISKRDETVVVLIDWSYDAGFGYFYAAHSAKMIAENLAQLIISDYQEGNVNLDKLTLIGDDIGAHIAGMVGKAVYRELNEKIGRIIATSPAGYHFKSEEEENKLSSSDAKCVAVIHTDNRLFGYRGLFNAMDFVVNKGYSQPGCNAFGFCSHLRARNYLLEAFNNMHFETEPTMKSFSGDKEMFLRMVDGNCDSGNGVYSFETGNQSPYL